VSTKQQPHIQAQPQIEQLIIDRSDYAPRSKIPFIAGLITVSCLFAAIWYWSSTAAATPNTLASTASVNQSKQAEETLSVSQYSAKKTTFKESQNTTSTSKASQPSVLDASGHVVARRIATVSSRVTGKLIQLHIEEGIEVKKHQILAELDDQQASISYQLALADLTAQQARLQETLVLEKYAQQKAQRREQLAKDNLISEQLSEDSQLHIEQLAAQLNNKKARVELAKQSAELALYQLEQHKIRAPFDGVVISKNAQVGELISAGSSGGGFIRTGVGTIVDMSSLEIEVEVGESYINRVHAGQQVVATLDAYPQWKIDSEVVAIIPTANRQKASIKVRVKLLESDQRILPDMGVKVSFLAQAEQNNIAASLSSISNKSARTK